MQKACLKCGHVNSAASGAELEACPSCGAIYSRVEAALASKARSATATAPQAQSATPAAPTQAEPAASTAQSRIKRVDEKFCSECGSVINAKAEICPKCGVRQMAPPSSNPLGKTTESGKNKLVAGLLAIFLGGLGIHKFYLGKGLQGVLYLVFFWTFIPAIIGFVEGVNYLLMSEKTFFERYGT